jgi:YD repeat-containing protein
VPGLVDHFTLTYDGLNRLEEITGPVAERFSLDGPSNVTTRTNPSHTYTYDQANRQTSDGSQSYTWSNADRLTSKGADTFGYDPLDRMTSSAVAGSARTYTYNGDGLLQSRHSPAARWSLPRSLSSAGSPELDSLHTPLRVNLEDEV